MSALRRLYRGDTNIDFIGRRKQWYIASALLLLVCVGSLAIRGFNFGIEFAGGSQFVVAATPDTASIEQVRKAVEDRGVTVASAQVRGGQDQRKYVIRTAELSDEQRTAAVEAIVESAGLGSADEVASSSVSSSWGDSVTNQALIGLLVFLVLVGVFIWIVFEQKMAIAALLALLHDLLLTAGVYSLIGFEVTPGTIVGLLTILGYSLYDTVVVFDKVNENTRGLLGSSRATFGEAANLAVNQTLMRSINTTIIGLLPVAGLLFVGAGLLGVGTLKDLALVLFVGMLTGTYSSLFLATPWVVDLKMLDPRYKLHAQRVLAKRAAGDAKDEGRPAGRGGKAAAKATARAGTGKAAGARSGSGKVSTSKEPTSKVSTSKAGTAVRSARDDDVDVDETELDDEFVDDLEALDDDLADSADDESDDDSDSGDRPGGDVPTSSAPRVGARPAGQRKRPSGRSGGRRR